MVIKKIVLVELFFIKFKYIYGYFFLGNNISFFCFGFENFWICVWCLLNFYMYCVYVQKLYVLICFIYIFLYIGNGVLDIIKVYLF